MRFHKHCLACMAGILLLLLVFPAPRAAADGMRETAVVDNPNPADRLNLRIEPSLSSDSLGKYYNGVTVEILKVVNNDWVRVRIGNVDGYMMRAYLRFNASTGSVPSAMPTVTVSRASGRRLNLREKPSVDSQSLSLYEGGTKVQVLGLTRDWYHVRAGDRTGFMMASYLTPQLHYSMGGAGGSQPVVSDDGAWNGPDGNHAVAVWTIPPPANTVIVNNPDPGDRMHLRAGPSLNSASLGKYYNGVTVILNGDLSGKWASVRIGNLTGYMKTEFLSANTADPPASAMPVMTVRNPNPAGNLHLRDMQSTSSHSLKLYPNGTQVILMGFTSTWAHVIVDGQMGFMMGKYLR